MRSLQSFLFSFVNAEYKIFCSEIRLVEIEEKLCVDEEKASEQVSAILYHINSFFSLPSQHLL